MKKWSVLKKVTVPTVVVWLAVMVGENVICNALQLKYTDPVLIPLRIAGLLAINTLFACIATKILQILVYKRYDEGEALTFKKFAVVFLPTSAVIVIADVLRSALLHPESSSASSFTLLFAFTAAAVMAGIRIKGAESVKEKAGMISTLIVSSLVALFALFISAVSCIVDILL